MTNKFEVFIKTRFYRPDQTVPNAVFLLERKLATISKS